MGGGGRQQLMILARRVRAGAELVAHRHSYEGVVPKMRFHKRTPFLATALLAVLAVAAVANAQFVTSGSPDAVSMPNASPGLASVPADQAQAFGVLRQPAAAPADIASAVQDQIATGPDAIAGFGLDLAQVRAVSPAGRRFYVAPAKKGICLFLEDGRSACTQAVDWIAKYGFHFSIVPPPAGKAGPAMGATYGPGEIVTYGIIGDGVTDVVGHTVSGANVKATITGNAYVIVTDSPVDVTQFSNATSSWTTAGAPKADLSNAG
jgi:hypothetical protein